MSNAETDNPFLRDVPAGPAAPLDMLTDGFDHDAYTRWRCDLMNQEFCKHGVGVCVPIESLIGPAGVFFPDYQWSTDDKAIWLKDKKAPVTWATSNPNDEVILMKFGKIRRYSSAYPGFADDMGHPLTFIHVGNKTVPFYFVLEAVDWGRSGDGGFNQVLMVPSADIDTPHRSNVNQDFMVTREAKTNLLMLKGEWEYLVAFILSFF